MFKFLIDLNSIDGRAFIPSCRYCLIGIALPAVVSIDFRFSLEILVWKLHDFPMDTAIIPIPWKVFFPSSVEILSTTHWTKSGFLVAITLTNSLWYNQLFVTLSFIIGNRKTKLWHFSNKPTRSTHIIHFNSESKRYRKHGWSWSRSTNNYLPYWWSHQSSFY